MRNRFFQLSTEDVENNVVEDDEVLTSEAPLEQLEDSFNKTADQTQQEILKTEQCSNCADELIEQRDQMEQQIDTAPEDVNQDVVELAQEQFYNTVSKVLSKEELQPIKLSVESAQLPIEKYILTREGIMDIIKTIIAKIIQAFKSVGMFFKKLWVKFIVYMDGTAKRCDQLDKEYRGKNLKFTVINEELLNAIQEKLGLFIICKNSVLASQILPFIRYNDVKKNLNNETIRSISPSDLSMHEELIKKLTGKLKENKENAVDITIYSVIDGNVKYIRYEVVDPRESPLIEDKEAGMNDENLIGVTVPVYDSKELDQDEFSTRTALFNSLDVNKVLAELKIVRNYASSASQYKDRLFKVFDDANNFINKLAKKKADEASFTKRMEITHDLKFAQLLGTKIILDNIMQYVKTCRYMLWMYEELLKNAK